MKSKTVVVVCMLVAALGCGGGGQATTPSTPTTPPPEPTPTPPQKPSIPAACQLQAPTVDCSTRSVKPQELAPVLQAGIDAAMSIPGIMYADVPGRIYDLDRFRAKVVERAAAENVCAAWDYGNESADEIYLRSADGCVVEQYDILTGEGGVRPAGKGSNSWQADFGVPVPGPKPKYPNEGDLTCSLEPDRASFCFSIRNSPGLYGTEAYRVYAEVMQQNPAFFDSGDVLQGEFNADLMRVPGWRITNAEGWVATLLSKLRAAGFCAVLEKGDILKVKKVANGNILHEEFDVVQNPQGGGAYTLFVVKDRCHNAGF